MHTLDDLAARLAAINSHDLARLRATIDASPQAVPGLLAWLEHAIDWERDRRRAGLDYPLRAPMDAIPDDELEKSLAAVELLAAKFRGDHEEIANLFDLVGGILRAEAERPNSLH